MYPLRTVFSCSKKITEDADSKDKGACHNFWFSDLNPSNAIVRHFYRQPKFECHSLSNNILQSLYCFAI